MKTEIKEWTVIIGLLAVLAVGLVALVAKTNAVCVDDCVKARVYSTQAQCEFVCKHRDARIFLGH